MSQALCARGEVPLLEGFTGGTSSHRLPAFLATAAACAPGAAAHASGPFLNLSFRHVPSGDELAASSCSGARWAEFAERAKSVAQEHVAEARLLAQRAASAKVDPPAVLDSLIGGGAWADLKVALLLFGTVVVLGMVLCGGRVSTLRSGMLIGSHDDADVAAAAAMMDLQQEQQANALAGPENKKER